MNHHLPHRQLEIDTLRGLACILLVSFHVVGVSDTGLRLPETHPLVRFNDMLAHIRMPLFSFISGYVYAARPLRGDATGFLRGKTRRLLLPVVTMGTLFALVQSLTPGTSGDINWWLLHIEPVGHFWFLQALFIIFVILACLERSGLLAAPGHYGLVFAASLVLYAFADHLPHYFAASGVAKLLPFFLGGLACHRFAIGSITIRGVAIALLVAAVVWLWAGPSHGASESLAGLTVGLAVAFLLLRSRWRNRPLALVGGYSFVIYLMHIFFTSASRRFVAALGLSDPYALLVLGTTAGVIGPVIAALILARFARLELLLLGQVSR